MTLPMNPFELDPSGVDLDIHVQFEGVALKAYGEAHGVSSASGPTSVALEGDCGSAGSLRTVSFWLRKTDAYNFGDDIYHWELAYGDEALAYVNPDSTREILFREPGRYLVVVGLDVDVDWVFDNSLSWTEDHWILADFLIEYWDGFTGITDNSYEPIFPIHWMQIRSHSVSYAMIMEFGTTRASDIEEDPFIITSDIADAVDSIWAGKGIRLLGNYSQVEFLQTYGESFGRTFVHFIKLEQGELAPPEDPGMGRT